MAGVRSVTIFMVALLALALAACRPRSTQLLVLVDSDLRPGGPGGLSRVVVHVRDTGPRDASRSTSTVEFPLATAMDIDAGAYALPLSFGVAPLAGAESRRLVVEAVGYGEGTRTVVARAVVSFSAGRALLVPLFLAASCVDRECPDDQTCSPTTGTCEDATTPGVPFDPSRPGSEFEAGIGRLDATNGNDGNTDGPPSDAVAEGGCQGADCNPVIGLSAGRWHTCALRDSGAVYCWGASNEAQLGLPADAGLPRVCPIDGMMEPCTGVPQRVPGLPPIAAIAAGEAQTCALAREGGQVFCWGGNLYGAAAPEARPNCTEPRCGVLPMPVRGTDGSTAVFATSGYSGAIRGGGLRMWGIDQCNVRGVGSLGTDINDVASLPGSVLGAWVGGQHACALFGGLGLGCWGANDYRELGAMTTDDPSPPSCYNVTHFHGEPVLVQGLPAGEVREVALGVNTANRTSCARFDSGAVWCWGASDCALLGRGASAMCGTSTPGVPGAVPGLDATHIAMSETFVCAARRSGGVVCWGSLPTGGVGRSASPVEQVASGEVRLLAAGWFHACAAMASGEVLCWGNGEEGQLGRSGPFGDHLPPAPVEQLGP